MCTQNHILYLGTDAIPFFESLLVNWSPFEQVKMKDRNGKKVSNHRSFPEVKPLFEEKTVGYLNRLYRSPCVSLVFIDFFMQKGFIYCPCL